MVFGRHARVVVLGGIAPFLVAATDRKAAAKEPDLYRDLMACQAISDAAVRLRCFDEASSKLKASVDGGEVYLTDRAQMRKTRRSLFGLPLPDLGIFGGGDESAGREALSQIETTVSVARLDADGWVVSVEDGSTWRQIDGAPLAIAPRKGMEVVIKRGALGSYRMSIRKQPPIKVRRTI